jgi:Ca2+-transporting ATPase
MIHPVHTKLRGRGRYKVRGLFGSKTLQESLETRLLRHKGILQVSASTVTGNVLVLFEKALDHRSVSLLLTKELEEITGTFLEPETQSRKSTLNALPPPRKIRQIPKRIGKKIVQLVSPLEEQKPQPWHLMKPEAVLGLWGTDRQQGLSREVVNHTLQRYGPNVLPEAEPRSRWSIFFSQFKSLPVLLLGAAAGISLLTGGILDAVVIAGVVAANAVIGYATESAAEKTIHSLKHMVHPTAEVVREGRVLEIPAEDLVPGDVLLLKPGTYVSADCRVLEASHLSIDESVLTGESMPVFKSPATLRGRSVPLPDRVNMVFMGTLVTGGEGVAVVSATGRFTEMGRLQVLLGETDAPETSFERQLRQVGDQLVVLCGAICGIVFLIGFLRGHGVLQMLRVSISLAASAVPEGLPAAATINFSLGIKRMRKDHVLVRRLQAIETLGAVQTVCLDKTGTLTRNRMSIQEMFAGSRRIHVRDGGFYFEEGPLDPLAIEEVKRLLHVCALCNETKINGCGPSGVELAGSPTECALMDLAFLGGIDVSRLRKEHPLVSVDHRTESRLYMRTLHVSPGGGETLCAVKGSPPEVLSLCSWQMRDGQKVPLTDQDRLLIERQNDRMAIAALRVLGVAFSPNGAKSKKETNGDLIWLGLVGMADPIRPGARELIEVYHKAGINTVMITGDQSPTAFTVARNLDLSGGEHLEILDSSELRSIPPEVFQALARKVHVYSRVSPSNKLQIVQALQRSGLVVAMTGDGINDGPALKAADIGIAMGRSGTDVAREVADIVLEEDNLETLVLAVRDGRTTYQNIRKSVHFFLSTNFTELMVMFASLAAGVGFPLNVMQLLWINIMSDIFPGLALSMEAPEPDVLQQQPRDPQDPLLSGKDYRRMLLESAVISSAALGAYGYGIARYGIGARAGTLAFHTLVAGQILHALSCRSEKKSLVSAETQAPNKYLTLAIGGSLFLQALTALVPGVRSFLGITPIGLIDAAVAGGSALLSLAANETTKAAGRSS